MKKLIFELIIPALLEHEPYLRILDAFKGSSSFSYTQIGESKHQFGFWLVDGASNIRYITELWYASYIDYNIISFKARFFTDNKWLYTELHIVNTLGDLYTQLQNYYGLDTELLEVQTQLLLLETLTV